MLTALNAPNRNPTIDAFRGLAILLVVLYHFNYTVYMGSLGVDLFFVISGFLVGGLLTKDYQAGKRIIFKDFFLKRGFKIWPSYYLFLLIGGIIGYLLYRQTNPELIPDSWWKYAFFYQNYTEDILKDMEWIYGHAWSLCVEEHFYILLPIIFILIQQYGNLKWLIASVITLILIGITSKVLTYHYTDDQDTYFTTHNRIDALAWGVLLNIFISYSDFVQRFRYKILAFFILLILFFLCFKFYFTAPEFFKKVVFRSLVPVLFAGMIGSLYYIKLKFDAPLRFVGYYSYNWYLWHPIISFTVMKYLGVGVWPLIVYLVSSFTVAVLFTQVIEEPFLALRKKVFHKKHKRAVVNRG